MGNYIRVRVCPVAKLCLTLYNPVDCSPPGSSVHGTLQTRILEWVVISSSRGSSQLRDQTCISCIGRWIFLPLEPPGKPEEIHKGYKSDSLEFGPEYLMI